MTNHAFPDANVFFLMLPVVDAKLMTEVSASGICICVVSFGGAHVGCLTRVRHARSALQLADDRSNVAEGTPEVNRCKCERQPAR